MGWNAGPYGGVGCRTPRWGRMQDPMAGWNAGPHGGWDAGPYGGMECRIPQWVEMQDLVVGWDQGAHDGVRCSTAVAPRPVSTRLKLLPNLRISMSLASREPAVA